MARIIILLLAYITAFVQAGAGFGSTFQAVINQPSFNYYQKFTSTLVVPPLPYKPTKDIVFLWPGMRTSNGKGTVGLFQPVLASAAQYPDYWALIPYLVNVTAGTATTGSGYAIKPGVTLTYTLTYNGNDQGYTQTVTYNGQFLTSWSAGKGYGIGFGALFAAECNSNANGVLGYHKYTNVSMQLGVKDPDFVKHTTFLPVGVKTSNLYTTDGALTWRYDTVEMSARQCTPT